MGSRFVDGLAPRVHAVVVTIEAEALRITFEDGAPLEWPLAALARADDGVGPVVLRLTADDGARLTLDDATSLQLRKAAPALFSRQAFGRGGFRVAFGLAITAAVLVGLLLVVLPLASGPLARLAPPTYEARIGELAWRQALSLGEECDAASLSDIEAEEALLALTQRLAVVAGVNQEVSFHLLDADFPNAFALPGGRVVVTDELIAMAEDPDELSGVIAHELAHVERRHVLANVMRQMGAGVLVDIVLGGGGVGQTAAALSLNVASMSYDRESEAEADRLAVQYLDKAELDPGGLAQFFDRLSAEEAVIGLSLPELLSTHPDTKARAARARAFAKPSRPPSLGAEDWAKVKQVCGLGPTEADEETTDESPPPPAP